MGIRPTLRARLNHEFIHQKKQGWWWILAILNHYIKFWLYHCIAIKIPSKPVVYVWVFSLSFPTISPPNFHSNHWKPVENSWKHHQTSAGLAHQFPTPSASSLATASIRPSWRLRFRRAWGWCQKEKYIQSFGRFRYFYIFLCMGKIWWSLMILWTSIYHQIYLKYPQFQPTMECSPISSCGASSGEGLGR